MPRDVVLGELSTREALRVGGAEVAEAATVQLVDILETQRGDPKVRAHTQTNADTSLQTRTQTHTHT